MKQFAPPKDPLAILDYEMDWSDWLADGVALTSASVTADSADLAVSNTNVEGEVVRWRLSAGVAGQTYKVAVQVETDNGQVDRRSINVKVVNR